MMLDDSLSLGAVRGKPLVAGNTGPEPCKISPYFTLDAWRGIAALWVVMLHSCLPYIQSGHEWFLKNPIYLVSIWGQLGVSMFFVMSGYCITGAAYNGIVGGKGLYSFCADRFRRIYPPYLAALSGAVVIAGVADWLLRRHLLSGYHPSTLPSISERSLWLANLTLTQVPAGWASLLIVAWSLCYEIAFYVIVATLLGCGLMRRAAGVASRLKMLLAGVSLLTIGSLVWLCISPDTCWFPLNLWYQFGLGSLLFLCVAVGVPAPGTFVRSLRLSVWLAASVTLLLTALYAALRADQLDKTQVLLGHPSTRVQAVATIIFCVSLYGLRRHDARLMRHKVVAVLAHLGAFSYSLYLVHTPMLPFVDAGLRKAGFTEEWYLVVYVGQVLVAVAAGWLFFLGVERRFISRRQKARLATE